MRILIILIFVLSAQAQDLSYEDYYCKETQKPFFLIKKEKGEDFVVPNRSKTHFFKFKIEKPKNKKRVFLIGESVAAIIYPNKDMPKGQPFFNQKDFEIYNFGMAAYDSERIKKVVKESLEYNPDAIIIMSGNNEHLSQPCEDAVSLIKKKKINLIYNLNRVFSGRKESLFNLSLDIQKKNLKEMIEKAKAKNVKVFLTALPSNLFLPPVGNRPADKNFIRAYKSYDSGLYREAFKEFKKLLENNPAEPFLNYYAGISAYKSGEANYLKFLDNAAMYDNRLDRTTDKRNEMMKELAQKEKVYFLDLKTYFLSLSKGNFIREDFFADGVHWLKKYNNGVQGFFLENLKAEGLSFEKESFSDKILLNQKNEDGEEKEKLFISYCLSEFTSGESVYKDNVNERALYFLERYLKEKNVPPEAVLRDIEKAEKNKFLNEQDFTAAIGDAFIAHLAEYYRRKGDIEPALKTLEKAKDKSNKIYETVYAFCRMDLGAKELFLKNAKDKEFLKAVNEYADFYKTKILAEEKVELLKKEKGDPMKKSKAKVYSDRGVEFLKHGKLKQARAEFQKALNIYPYHFESLMNMAYIKMDQKDFEGAFADFELITKNPEAADREGFCRALSGQAYIAAQKKDEKNYSAILSEIKNKCGKSDRQRAEGFWK